MKKNQKKDLANDYNAVQRIEGLYQSLRESEKKVADYILKNQEDALESTITELAKNSAVSEASVIRFCKAIGYKGFQELKIELAKSQSGEKTSRIFGEISKEDDLELALNKIFTANLFSLNHALNSLNVETLKQAAEKIKKAKNIILYGVGSSALVADYASYRFSRIGMQAKEHTSSHSIVLSTSIIKKEDLAIFISQSASTKVIVNAIKEAKKRGAYTILISGHLLSPAAKESDLIIEAITNESPYESGAVRSLLVQLSIIDALMATITLKNYDELTPVIKSTAEALKNEKY